MTRPQPPDSPLNALWQTPVIVWVVLVGEGLAIILALAPGIQNDRWIYFGLTSLIIQWVSLLTLGILYLLRRSLSEVRPQRIAYIALGLLLCTTCAVSGVAWLLLRDLWSMTQDGWQALFLRFNGIALAVGLFGLAAFQNHVRVRQLAVQAKQFELEALQARIRPHFLFNTLNTGAALVHGRPADAEQLLLDLADLFRAALGGPKEIPLEDELALTRRYLEIESLRFNDRLRIDWRLPAALPNIDVPTLSIQPLVENAIRHGVENTPEGGVVQISVSASADAVGITIRNALPPNGVTKNNTGHNVGLSSVRTRIEALTQGRGRLETGIDESSYVATIHLPLGRTEK
jgi:two-component system sensor histidine kinase AlgZ